MQQRPSRLSEADRAAARGAGRRYKRPIAAFAAIVAFAAGAAALHFSLRGHTGVAPEPVTATAAVGEPSREAISLAAEAQRYLRIFAALEDERVIAALAPIVDLSCKRSDYQTLSAAGEAWQPEPGPLERAASLYTSIEQSVTTVALAPVVHRPHPTSGASHSNPLQAPMSAPPSDIDALMTRNLIGAALAPIAALPSPERALAPVRVVVAASAPPGECPALLRHTFNRLQTGEPQSLCQFQGKVLLVVNTASFCGYTKQYEGLEALYRKYRDRGLVVVGFPSNDFGSQEPGSNREIAEFCRTTYGVRFPMFEKSSVARLDANPLYIELRNRTGAAPKWNFHKYVVDRSGTRVASFASDVTPDARSLVDLIERLLADLPGAGSGCRTQRAARHSARSAASARASSETAFTRSNAAIRRSTPAPDSARCSRWPSLSPSHITGTSSATSPSSGV